MGVRYVPFLRLATVRHGKLVDVSAPPDERRWTMAAGVVLALCLVAAGIVTAAIPIRSSTGDRPPCGTALFHDDPVSCGGASKPYALVALAFFALAIAAVVRVVMVARRRSNSV